VWQALREIAAGETVSYAEIARRIGSPKAARAVAGACAQNNLAVAIPCHRVRRNDGSGSQYAWGVERRRLLLDREVCKKASPQPGPALSRPGRTGHAGTRPGGLARAVEHR
jgi:AraC family transcriptional regulator of adaptative response/methylated-DNA-[protein]-cysteine methyltransferase